MWATPRWRRGGGGTSASKGKASVNNKRGEGGRCENAAKVAAPAKDKEVFYCSRKGVLPEGNEDPRRQERIEGWFVGPKVERPK